ncbi:MAG: nodulation protein NodZ [Myxococcaceae bacterium]
MIKYGILFVIFSSVVYSKDCRETNDCLVPHKTYPWDQQKKIEPTWEEEDEDELYEEPLWSHKKIRQDDAVILESRSDNTSAGMFSIMDDVWALLDCYHARICSAVKIDFGKSGLYYDSKKGPNWFDYYFLPIDLGTTQGPFIKTQDPSGTNHRVPEFNGLDRMQINSIIHEYIVVRPEIELAVQKFVDSNFKHHFVFGVHYRGTDKSSEAPVTRYPRVTQEIHRQVDLKKLSNYKIFVATDAQEFLEYIESQFPGKIIHVPNIERSTDGKPLHINKHEKQYEIGRGSLIDCLLLSRTNLLIRTSSNLSRWSTYFNPELPVIELSQRHDKN